MAARSKRSLTATTEYLLETAFGRSLFVWYNILMSKLSVEVELKEWSINSKNRQIIITVGFSPLGLTKSFIKEYFMSYLNEQTYQGWKGLSDPWTSEDFRELITILDELILNNPTLFVIQEAMIKEAHDQLRTYINSKEEKLKQNV